MAFWEIERRGERLPADEWGVTVASRRLQSLAPDVLSLTLVDVPEEGESDIFTLVQRNGSAITERSGDALWLPRYRLWNYRDTITVYRNNVRWFTGIITKLPWEGSEDFEGQTIEVSGPWWYLENIVFQQNWKEIDIAGSEVGLPAALLTRQRSRVLLGLSDGGSRISTGLQISSILSYAIGAGADFSIGTILSGINAWTVEARDQTCAEIIRTILRWHPDAIASFDYSTETPTLKINPPESTYSLLADDRRTVSFNHTPRPDLVPPSVAFYYEKDHDFDGSTFTTTDRDVFPEGSTGSEPGAVVATIPLRGATRSTQKQRIKTETIPTETTGENVEAWWFDRVQWLKEFNETHADKLSIGNHDRVLADIGDEDPEPISGDYVVTPTTDPDDYPRQLINGTIEDWMNARAERMIVHADVVYFGDDFESNEEAQKLFDQEIEVDGTVYPGKHLDIEITATDATTKLYSRVVKSEPPEATPSGLAQAYHVALSELQHQGTVTLLDEESGWAIELPFGFRSANNRVPPRVPSVTHGSYPVRPSLA